MDHSWSDDELNDEDVFEEEEDVDMDEEEEMEEDGEAPNPISYSVYRRKYNLLLERCRAIQQDNELLVSRVKEVKKLRMKGMKERKLLIKRLDSHGDNFRNVPIIIPAEEDSSVGKKLKDKKVKKVNSVDDAASGGSGTSKGRKMKGDKEKVPRDPNLPKRPQNPFFQFCKEKREVVAKDVYNNQGINLTKKELTKILANQWNSLDTNAKQIYNERFEEEKAGYTIKMEVYRKLKDESEQTISSQSSSNLNTSQNSFLSSYDYDDSYD